MSKKWEDDNNRDGLRPKAIYVQLKADDNEYMIVKLSESNDWKYTFKNLPKFNKTTTPIVYTIEESDIPLGYEVSYNGTEIINTHIPQVTSVNVSKVWNDSDNQDGIRVDEVTVELRADGTVINTTKLNAENQWSATFANLPKYKEGKEINYTITENGVPNGYEVTVKYCDGIFKVVNTHIPENTSVDVTKVWDDADNQDGIRPSSVTVNLYADGNLYQTAVIEASRFETWTYTFTNLPKFKGSTTPIVYTVKEVVPSGYDVSIDGTTITNTHVPELVNISVNKVWDDGDNQDNIRPDEVSIDLLDGDVVVKTITVKASEGWTGVFENLPKYKNGKEINYVVNESQVPANYTVSIDGTVVINTHVPEVVNVTVNKVWNDSGNQDGIRPSSVTVNLYADGNLYDTVVVNDTWTYTFTNLPKFNKTSTPIVYTVKEVVPSGYDVSINGTTITNTHIPGTTSVDVAKVWNDNDNQDGLRPTVISVDLLADGTKINSTNLTEDNHWMDTFANLPKYKDGKEIKYTINESQVPNGYTVTVKYCDGVFKVVNTHIPENTSVDVTKVWNDNDNQDGIRPNNVTVYLLVDGEVVSTGVILEDNDWIYTFNNLPKYANGKLIKYDVKEVNVAEGYTTSVDKTTITNTHIPEVVNITVNKVWNDSDNQDNIRPTELKVDLLVGNDVVKTITVKQSEGWTGIFENMPKYKDGKEIKYTINESQPPSGYTATINGTTVVNTHIPDAVNITVNKVWNDGNNQDGIRPSTVTVNLFADGKLYKTVVVNNSWTYTFTNLPKYNKTTTPIVYTVEEVVPAGYNVSVDNTTITNTHIPENTSVNVSKIWNDNNNQDGLRPTVISVDLLADGKVINSTDLTDKNNWTATFTNLAKYANGKAIAYTISESQVPEGYNVTIKFCDGIFKVINTHYTQNTSVDVSKVWDDNNNRDAMRTDYITVRLIGSNGIEQFAVLNTTNGWKYTFKNLPMYYDEGKLVEYNVDEVSIPQGYTKVITNTSTGFIITNTHVPQVTNITVTKTWIDNDNQDNMRPGEVSVVLLANGIKVDEVTLKASDNWKYSFINLPMYENGKLISYTVDELVVPENYTKVSVQNISTSWTITNRHIPENTSISVQKIWNDADNQDGIRPESISVQVTGSNGIKIIAVLDKNNDWKYTFTNLPKYEAGKAVTYTVDEVNVPKDYTKSITNTTATFTITNTHIPEITSINVSKVWNDSDNQDAIRPDNIVVDLYANGKKINETILTADNGWKYSFNNLAKYSDGTIINYTVAEEKIDNYTTAIKNCSGQFVIINTHVPQTTEVSVKKVWDDEDNQDNIQPPFVVIILKADGQETDEITLNAENNWTSTFTNLPKYSNGKIIVYMVDEKYVPVNYTKTVTNTSTGFVITNVHKPDTTNVTVKKIWNDSDDNDAIRPENVTIVLYADGTKVDQTILTKQSNWTYTFNNLPKYSNQKVIIYTVDELNTPAGYTKDIEKCCLTFTITNTHIPEVTNISVNKVWNDSNNQDGIRPTNVAIQLDANGQKVEIITLNQSNNWKHTFNNLPKYSNGKIIQYTVFEVDTLINYTATITNTTGIYTITNTHIPEVTSINVTKVWNDTDNSAGLRPANVEVQLFRDGQIIDNVILSQSNNWKYTFTNLPKYDNGKLIKYSVDEMNVPEYYTKTVEKCCLSYTITNTYAPEYTTVTVAKVWDDGDDNDALRPDNITVQLKANNNTIKEVTLSKLNDWKYTFDKLDVYMDGQKIIYTIDEKETPQYYTKTITNNGNSFIITNTHKLEVINITITKKWDDHDDYDKIRPVNVTVDLYANGIKMDTVTLNAANNWKHVFTNLNKYSDSREITYTVEETSVPEGYANKTTNNNNEFIIINGHNCLVNITVQKEWLDNDNNDNIRPENVKVILLADGNEIDSVLLSADNNWKHLFENLPQFNDDQLIKYSVDEVDVDGYSKVVTNNDTNYIITNNHTDQNVNITVNKIWDDCDDNDGIRPELVEIYLYADNKLTNTIKLYDGNNWVYTFKNLPKYAHGKLINYSIVENEIAGYESYITQDNGSYTITNKHAPDVTSVNVTKVWIDKNNTYNLRPDNIVVNLYADGNKITSATLDKNNNWTYSFNNLQMYNNKKLVNYAVDEEEVLNYTCSIEETASNVFTLRNTLHLKLVFKWGWKLIGINGSGKGEGEDDYINPDINKNDKNIKSSVYGKQTGKYGKYGYNSNRYSPYNKYSRYNKAYRHNKHNYNYRYSYQKYRLFIYLYHEYLFGNMSYADFVAILNREGISISDFSSAWDSTGTITIDYDDLEDVPDSITLTNTKGDVPDSSDHVDKYNAPSAEHVIDQGEVEVEIVMDE